MDCPSRACLVHHFRGRTTCPYGQNEQGKAPDGQTSCKVPNSETPVAGGVCSQCKDRTADKAVYCSCRCANVYGKTNDGANYCECPKGFVCQQLINSIGPSDVGLTGGYCIRAGTEYLPHKSCLQSLAADEMKCGA
ncbi:hypothetical protein BCY86_01605 [Pajaroellobacter abortibovis]|uniref:Uncharacterized protein n=2 Tax=Pajaroellobacter abortibovis TaxID=1882918 RepID=A0A1L6MVR9_9BACT|nr:hypothetical protein BCY86_01605 [Pajaroellobacter abortibovis]